MISGVRRIGSKGKQALSIARGASQVINFKAEQLGHEYNAYKALAKDRYTMVKQKIDIAKSIFSKRRVCRPGLVKRLKQIQHIH
jgi:hypothetical protein